MAGRRYQPQVSAQLETLRTHRQGTKKDHIPVGDNTDKRICSTELVLIEAIEHFDFQEDTNGKRNKNIVWNFSLISKVAIKILKNDQAKNISIRKKKNIAA
jgi:hypothetical protein